ncbi:hypothetical protein [Neptuniibacter sp. QD37_11]|uniref:hypothetical protein n=1 Tax=Neptuniibacter sp. QD37_11 TaxID=3398209 RepID=UPI0039F5DD8F
MRKILLPLVVATSLHFSLPTFADEQANVLLNYPAATVSKTLYNPAMMTQVEEWYLANMGLQTPAKLALITQKALDGDLYLASMIGKQLAKKLLNSQYPKGERTTYEAALLFLSRSQGFNPVSTQLLTEVEAKYPFFQVDLEKVEHQFRQLAKSTLTKPSIAQGEESTLSSLPIVEAPQDAGDATPQGRSQAVVTGTLSTEKSEQNQGFGLGISTIITLSYLLGFGVFSFLFVTGLLKLFSRGDSTQAADNPSTTELDEAEEGVLTPIATQIDQDALAELEELSK